MNLDETQKETVKEWIQSRMGLSEIQSKIDTEFGVSMTYMDVRFLVDDLGGLPAEPDPEPEPEEAADPDKGASEGEVAEAPATPEPSGMPAPNPLGDDGAGAPSNVSVTVDKITRAGALASGNVTFSDGKSAGWSLDQMGRLGLSSDDPGYKPSQEDVVEFQSQLQKKLSGPGF